MTCCPAASNPGEDGSHMSRRTRRLLVVTAAALGALVLALLVAPLFVDADSFRPTVERMAKERLGRSVTLGRMSVSFLPPQVTVKDVVVAGAEGGAPWIEAKAMRVRASWGGLLTRRLVIRSVALDSPSVRLLRAPDGRWNLLEMVRPKDGAPRSESAVTLDEVAVRDGRVEVVDAFVRPGSVSKLSVHGLDARVRGLSSGGRVDATVSGEIPGSGRASWDGRLGSKSELSGRARLQDLALAPLAPWLSGLTGMPTLEGTMTTDLEIERGGGSSSAKGSVAVSAFRLPVAQGAAPVDASAEVDVRGGEGLVTVERFDVKTGGSALSARGEVRDDAGRQAITLELDAPRVSLREIAGLFAALGTALPISGLEGDAASMKGRARIVRGGEPRAIESVALDSVRVRGVSASLVKDATGWHAASAARRSEAPSPKLSVRDLSVTDATIRLTDATRTPPVSTDVTDVSLSVASWSPGEAGAIDLSARVASGDVSLKGQVAAPEEAGGGAPWDARLSVKGLDLAKAAALASAVGLKPKSGTADWSATLTGRPDDLAVRGRLDLKSARIPLESGRVVELDLGVDHDVRMLSQGRVRLDRLVLGLPGGPLELDGRVQTGERLRYDIGTKAPARLTPEDVAWLVALAGEALPFEIETTDPLAVDARVRDAGTGLEMSGTATLSRAVVRHEAIGAPVEVARASVSLRGDGAEVRDAALRLGASALAGSLSVDGFDDPSLRFDLSSSQADLDELFSLLSSGRAAATGDAKPSLARRLRGGGRLRVDRASFGGIELDAFGATVALRDGRFVFEPARVQLYGGAGTGRAAFDLSGAAPRFDVDFSLDGVDVKPLLAAGLGYQDLSGRGRVQGRLQGTASGGLAGALESMVGDGTLSLVDGEIAKLDALRALEKASVFGERSLASLGSRLSREGTRFESLDARWTMRGGVLRFDDARLVAPDADIGGAGSARLITKDLDADAVITFSQALSEQMRAEGSRAADVFWDARSGRVVLPARLSGAPGSMKATIDWGAALSQVLRRRVSDLGGGGGSGDSGSGAAPGLLDVLLGGGSGRQRSDGSAREAAPAREPAREVSASPDVRVDSARMGGSVLAPSLKLKATLSGARLSHGVVIVTGPGGREVAREDRAFEQQVRDFYAAAPRDAPAEIQVKLSFGLDRLGGLGPFTVSIVAVDEDGRESRPQPADVEAFSPF